MRYLNSLEGRAWLVLLPQGINYIVLITYDYDLREYFWKRKAGIWEWNLLCEFARLEPYFPPPLKLSIVAIFTSRPTSDGDIGKFINPWLFQPIYIWIS